MTLLLPHPTPPHPTPSKIDFTSTVFRSAGINMEKNTRESFGKCSTHGFLSIVSGQNRMTLLEWCRNHQWPRSNQLTKMSARWIWFDERCQTSRPQGVSNDTILGVASHLVKGFYHVIPPCNCSSILLFIYIYMDFPLLYIYTWDYTGYIYIYGL